LGQQDGRGTIRIDRVPHGVTVVVLAGEHDMETAAEVTEALDDARASGDAVVVDVTELQFADSSIVHAILYGFERAQRSPRRAYVVQIGTEAIVERLFDLTGVLDAVPHAEERDTAVRLALGAALCDRG
jgi:anti-anti-sigma factor